MDSPITPIRIGLKLCGNCNPELEIGRVLALIREMVSCCFVSFEEPEYELLLVVSSCAVACACCENHSTKLVVAEGLNFCGKRETDEEALARELAYAIRTQIGERTREGKRDATYRPDKM